MNTRTIVAAAALAVGLGCGGTETGPPGPPPPPPPPPPANTVNMVGNTFDPQSINASARGATITWNWPGGTGHNITFEDNVNNAATQSSGTHQRTFSNAGTFRYQCTIHSTPGNFTSGMVGSVVVP